MKPSLRAGNIICRTFRILLLLLLPVFSYSQTYFATSSNPADNGTLTTATVAVTPPGAMVAGDLVVIYAQYRAAGATLTINAGANSAGQTWTSETDNDGSNLTTRVFWCRYNGTWVGNPVVSGGNGTNPFTAVMYVFRPSVAGSLWGLNVAQVNSSSAAAAVTINGVTTTLPKTVTVAFWGSEDDNTFDAATATDWSNFPTAQYRNTGGGDQSNTAAYNIQANPATLQNVTKTQITLGADNSRTSILSFYELNNDCESAVPLTSSATCSNTPGTLTGATYTALSGACGASSGNRNDVWYSFVAQTTNPIIQLSTAPSNASLQLYTGNCTSLTAVTGAAHCVLTATTSATMLATGLSIGTTYYIRVFSNNNTAGTFNICVVDPPANDLCSGATAITSSSTTCTTTAGTLTNSSNTTVPGSCNDTRPDVWYSFTAQTTNPTITVGTIANGRFQVFSGSCGSLSSLFCSTASSQGITGLIVGQTYFVRVYSTTVATGALTICIADFPPNDECTGAAAISFVSSNCVTTAGNLGNSTYVTVPGSCGASRPDVWYSFVAQTTNPTITIGTIANGRFQVFSGPCGSLGSIFCSTASSQAVTPALTVGVTYYVRVYSTSVATGPFTICIVDFNDACNAATTVISSSTTCTTTAGTLTGSTYVAVPGGCGASRPDVWYSFTAQSTNPIITIGTIANGRFQVFSGTCGSLSSVLCSTTASERVTGLTIGQTYLVRVYSTTVTTGALTICVLDPPSNDECSGAITLPVNATCSNYAGTVIAATASTPTALNAACGGGNAVYDVWYRFTAVTTGTTTVTISSIGANFTNRRMEAYTGICGTLIYNTCTTTNALAVTTTAGTSYYIRVASTSGASPVASGAFNICVTTAVTVPLRYGNSYVNVSKRSSGGQVQPGDTLEIRMTINHPGSGTVYFPRYVDNVPTNTTMLTNEPIRIITNEGLSYKTYTTNDGVNDDAATYKSVLAANEFNIRMNLGSTSYPPGAPTNNTATNTGGAAGRLNAGSDNPRGGGGMIFATAFRVVVSGSYGDTISLYPGEFRYKTTNVAGDPDVVLTAIPYNIIISNPLDLCANSIGVNIASESGGTFGTGASQSRSTDLAIPISSYSYVNNVNPSDINSIGDGKYSIVKNISPKSTTDRNARRVPNCSVPAAIPDADPLSCNNRMFGGHWDVDGDHTGSNNSIGNLPAGINEQGGYMLLVNADFVASEVYRQTISTLCPNTYYEFSAWVRNVCPTCGMDSLARQFNVAMDPALVGGYAGVNPNLSFALNGIDIYSSGEIQYASGWVKKGFVFLTGSVAQTYNLSIRNNSQGGGGNDWALDDIAVATCFPNMTYSPSAIPNVCEGNVLRITDTVRSYFNNYVEWKWEKSTTGPGGPWIAIPAATGTTTPFWNATLGVYEFVTAYNIPPGETTAANDGDLYRLVVASTPDNLTSSSCSYTDPTTITINVLPACGPPLKADLLSATGRLNNNTSKISWTTSQEDEPITFNIERSDDGINFRVIATVDGYNNSLAERNNYNYTDPVSVTAKVYYKVVMINTNNGKKYSSIIQLNPTANKAVDFGAVTNPFSSSLQYELHATQNTIARIDLVDANGKIVKSENRQVYIGSNSMSIDNTTHLAKGMYILRAVINGNIIYKKVIKN